MGRTGRPGLPPSQKTELWKRWRAGDSISDIARGLDKNAGSIFGVLRLRGGIAPVARRRSRLALTQLEREEISRGIAAGRSVRAIASQLKRAPSTVSREIQRNGGETHYRSSKAEERAWERSRRPKKMPACDQWEAAANGREQAEDAVVAAADFRVAENALSGSGRSSDLARSNLSNAFRASEGLTEKGTAISLALRPRDAPCTNGHAQGANSLSNH